MIYTIYVPANEPLRHVLQDAGQRDVVRAIPEGLAKWALVFPPLWLAVHKLWWPLAFYALFSILMFGLLATHFWLIPLFLGGIPGLYLMLEGYQLCRHQAEAEGLELAGLVEASSESIAIGCFLERQWSGQLESPLAPNNVSETPSRYSAQLSRTADRNTGGMGLFPSTSTTLPRLRET